MDRLTKHLAHQFRAARLAKGLTQAELGARLEMATESISHIERGVTMPSLKTLAAAADAMGTSLSDLFAGLNDKRPISPRRAEQEALLRRLGRDLDDKRLVFVVDMATAVEKLP